MTLYDLCSELTIFFLFLGFFLLLIFLVTLILVCFLPLWGAPWPAYIFAFFRGCFLFFFWLLQLIFATRLNTVA
jgi:hypothetical protein